MRHALDRHDAFMHAALASRFVRAAFMRHTDPSWLHHPVWVECSPGELLTRAAFMQRNNKGHIALKRYTTLKGLTRISSSLVGCQFVSGSKMEREDPFLHMQKDSIRSYTAQQTGLH